MVFEDEEKESNVYGSEAREELEENDEISPEEEAFMAGYEEDEEEEEEDDTSYERTFDENLEEGEDWEERS